MKRKITLKTINLFDPCYDPKEIGFTSKMSLTPIEFIDQFKDKVNSKEDIIWLLCRKQFMTDKDLRLFAVWCAREALKLDSNPDERSINACNVAERFANGEATQEELAAAGDAARAAWAAARAAWAAAGDAARAAWAAARAAWAAARDARDAARDAAWDARDARDAQLEKLKEYFV